MKPPVPQATRFLAAMMRDDLAPQLTGFRAGNASMAAAMLDMLADEWDVAAARLVDENRKLHAIVKSCAEVLGMPEVHELDQSELRISALTDQNEALRIKLIEVHAALECETGAEAAKLEDDVWAFLRETVESRRIASANY